LNTPAIVALILTGACAGAAGSWTLSRSAERVRRIRYELRAAKKGLHTLKKMLRREATALIKVAGILALITTTIAAILLGWR
jgi:hypothetical protein